MPNVKFSRVLCVEVDKSTACEALRWERAEVRRNGTGRWSGSIQRDFPCRWGAECDSLLTCRSVHGSTFLSVS